MKHFSLLRLYVVLTMGGVLGSAVTPPARFLPRIKLHCRRGLLVSTTTTTTNGLVTSIRGGDRSQAFPLSLLVRDVVATYACYWFMEQATDTWLDPAKACRKYGLSTNTLNVACHRKLATAYISSAVTMYGLLFQKCTRQTAVGAAAVVWMFEQRKARLSAEAEEIGRPVFPEYLVATIATLTAYGTLLDLRFSEPVMKISAALLLLNGVTFFFAPASACGLWRVPVFITVPVTDKKRYPEQLTSFNKAVFQHRYLGVALTFSGILQTILAWEGDIYQALGCGCGFLFSVNCWSYLMTTDFFNIMRSPRVSNTIRPEIDLKKFLSKYFFIIFNGVVCSVLLLCGRGAPTTPIER
jgi:hypothetical protein